MPAKHSHTLLCLSAVLGCAHIHPAMADTANNVQLGDVTVTGTREKQKKSETPMVVNTVSEKNIRQTRPAHPSEIMNQLPGVYINRTSGEGHMTAIRQPLSTSPVYLFLEDGIPIRSTGFFNHNALYETNLPQAQRIEVIKGPGTALYGSDAIGGVINITTRPAPVKKELGMDLEAGEHGWRRLLLSGGNGNDNGGFRTDLNLTHTDGWRDGTEYDRQSGTLRLDRFLASGATLKTILSIANINQQTAGSSRLSEQDYLNNPTTNYTPISYRDVRAIRLSSAYELEGTDSLLSITPYFRYNRMEYMPNWSFTYDPNISDSQNYSAGLMLKIRKDYKPNRTRVIAGVDMEHSPGSRLENSIDAIRSGSIYTSYTLSTVIYDYDVTYQSLSPYLHVETSPADRLRLTAGLRYDAMRFQYDNRIADGALVINPTSTSFPITYLHPSDTTVHYSHLSPKLGLTYALDQQTHGFVSYRHAFRVPSESQLFRSGRTVNSTALKPVKSDSFEIGLRGHRGAALRYEVALYYLSKRDDILTYTYPDNTRELTNAGKTLHRGIEMSLGRALGRNLDATLAFAYAKHTYEDWKPNTSTDLSGQEMSSAPRTLANLRLNWKPDFLHGGQLQTEWMHVGSYWMDDNNTEKYKGHELLHLRTNYPVGKKTQVYARLMNVLDTRYATAASYTSSSGREFAPGEPRTLFLGIRHEL